MIVILGQTISVLLITKPVIFYGVVNLLCMIPQEDFNHGLTLKWGRGDRVLTTKTTSIDYNKYTQETKDNGFILTIYNFNISDVNHVYFCYYDFNTEPFNLTMRQDWLLLPSNESLDKQIDFKDERFDVRLTFKEVFPLPTCKFNFNELDISNKYERNISNVGIFFSVDFFLSYKTSECGYLNIICALKTKIIVDERRYSCQAMTEHESWKPSTIGVIFACCLIFTLSGLAVYLNYRRVFGKKKVTAPDDIEGTVPSHYKQ